MALLGAVAASTQRIDSFLQADHPSDQQPAHHSNHQSSDQLSEQNPLASSGAVVCLPQLRAASLAWAGPPVLHSLSLTVLPGECLAVTGEVGCGKSSLLQAMLGELTCTSGSIKCAVPGGVAYVPQQPLVIAGTILDNILMGRAMDNQQLDIALEASQLTHDVSQMPAGVHTRVGERGQSLSGGQQARLGIARALFAPASLVVLDDPVAAVDPRVASAIFRAVHALTPQRTVVMVLNQVSCDYE